MRPATWLKPVLISALLSAADSDETALLEWGSGTRGVEQLPNLRIAGAHFLWDVVRFLRGLPRAQEGRQRACREQQREEPGTNSRPLVMV